MPWYNDLRPEEDNHQQSYALVFPQWRGNNAAKARTISNLLKLRGSLDQQIRPKLNDQNLLIASWNIKEFGQLNNRLPESYFYIAEILSRFDLIAIQEIKNTLDDLFIIMRLLGKDWDYLINDITEGVDGNSERFCYIYDKRRVKFSGLAGEIVLWDEINKQTALSQLKRTPYLTGFKAGWKSFAIINVHLNPKSSKKAREIRKSEIESLALAIEKKIKKKSLWTENLMIMGDFNLYRKDDDMVQILADNGFKEVNALVGKATNVIETEAYDRIFYRHSPFFEFEESKSNGGVFAFYDCLFNEEDYATYKAEMYADKGKPETLVDDAAYKKYFRNYWRKNQMSDHYPIWVEMKIDSSDKFLAKKQKQLEALVQEQPKMRNVF